MANNQNRGPHHQCDRDYVKFLDELFRSFSFKMMLSLVLALIAFGLLLISGFKHFQTIDVVSVIILLLIIVIWAYEA